MKTKQIQLPFFQVKLVGIKMLCILGMFCSCTTFFLLWLELASLTAPFHSVGLSKNDETYVFSPTYGGNPSPPPLEISILDCTREDHFEVLALDQSCLTRFKNSPRQLWAIYVGLACILLLNVAGPITVSNPYLPESY